jgi:hypothetical protein
MRKLLTITSTLDPTDRRSLIRHGNSRLVAKPGRVKRMVRLPCRQNQRKLAGRQIKQVVRESSRCASEQPETFF